MSRFFLFLLFQLVFVVALPAQTGVDTLGNRLADSLQVKDSMIRKDSLLHVPVVIDSFSKKPVKDSGWALSSAASFSRQDINWQILQHHPYFGFSALPISFRSDVHEFVGKELLFYLLVFLLIVYALLRQLFPKYFNDLFRLFFRTTIKQRQIRDQLMQTPLPSLLLNGFFIISGGLYISFLSQYFQWLPANNFWLMFIYCIPGLSAAYFLKFLGLKLSGWLFSMQEVADSYIFIVFIVNKMLGILLLPFLVLLAFSLGDVKSIALTISWCVVAGLFIYRFILTFAAVRNQVKVNPFHFFLYLCAVEIAPLLLIYKGLLLFFRQTA